MAIVIPLVTEYDPKGLDRAVGDFQRAEGAGAKMKVGLEKAFVPAAAALAGLGAAAWDFSKAAMEDAKGAAELARSLQATTGASKAQVAATEEWITAQGKALGVADDELRPALSKLAQATGSVSEAQKAAALAMDLAAASGKPVEVTAQALAKAYDGNTGALKKLVPGLDEAILKSGDMAAIQQMLADKVGGAASTAAETAAGKMQRFQLAIGEAKESIGAALLPIIEKLIPYLMQFADWVGENTQLLVIVGGVIGTVAGAIVVLNAVLKAWAIVQAALNLVLSMNPIGLVVIAIAALVAGVILAYNKVSWFKAMMDGAFQALGIIFTALGTVVSTVFNGIKTAIEWAWNFIQPIIEKIKGALDFAKGAIDTIGGVIGGIGGIFGRSAPTVVSSRNRSSQTFNVNVSTGVGNPVAIAREIEAVLKARNVRLGLV